MIWSTPWIHNWEKIIYTECKWLNYDGKPMCPFFIILTKCWLWTIWKEYVALNYYSIIKLTQQHMCLYLLQKSAGLKKKRVSRLSLSSEVSTLTTILIANCSYMKLKLGWFMDVTPRKAKKKSISMILEGRPNFVVNPMFVWFFLRSWEEGEGLHRMVEMKRI